MVVHRPEVLHQYLHNSTPHHHCITCICHEKIAGNQAGWVSAKVVVTDDTICAESRASTYRSVLPPYARMHGDGMHEDMPPSSSTLRLREHTFDDAL